MPPDETTRTLTLDEAVALANRLQQDGAFGPARQLYEGVLAVQPAHADALHFAGVLAHHDGRGHDAVALVERSLALEPGRADYHNNLGIILQAHGRLDEAMTAYRRAIALDARHANAHSNLGVLLRAAGQPDAAESEYRSAIAIDPAHADAHTNLGVLLNGVGRAQEAVASFCRALTLRPKHPEARRLLALAHSVLGEVDEAVAIYDAWLNEAPDDPVARHMRAACTGHNVPPRASDAFIERTFDGFSVTFEAKLARLSYRAPSVVVALVEAVARPPTKAWDVLDAGCGTGLCGPLLAPYARTLTGVDLSQGMLTHARDKHVYDTLVRAELTGYLLQQPGAFDLIVSADTLVYFGDLEPVVRAARAALRPAGRLAFTLEHAGSHVDEYCLEPHGRFSHARGYVERVLETAGFADACVQSAELRFEAGTAVAGLVVCATA